MNLPTTISNQCNIGTDPESVIVYKKRSKDIFFASVSDIHLAHPRTVTCQILEGLRAAFPDNEETGKLDVIFFAGDVFDRLMTLPQVEVDAIQEWIADFLKICVRWDIIVRVLEGTPSHDWNQSKQFVNANDAMSIGANLKYVTDLSIEVIDELDGLSILYVPDEWNHDASVTRSQVKELLSIHGMESVNMSVMHGAFDYQLPIESIKNHSSDFYKSITKDYIVIGHVHIRTENGHILAQGSFDRLSHGEEAAKGHYRGCISPVGNYHWFVENKLAKIYKTIDCRDSSLNDVFEVMNQFEELPTGSCFRLLLKRDSVVYHGIKDLRRRYPQFSITTQLDDLKKQEDTALNSQQTPVVKPITITPNNVDQVVDEYIKKHWPDLDSNLAGQVMNVLNKYK